jgi:hypothetical protein
MGRRVHDTYCKDYTCVLNYILGLTREYAKYDMHEHADYKVEISYRVYMNDYKVRLTIYEIG